MDLKPWHKNMLAGMPTGELKVIAMARNSGKSMLSSAAFRRLWEDIYKEKAVEDLILSEGKVFGATYYCVEPVGGNWRAMSAWCRKSFGDPAEVWKAHEFIWPDCGRWYENDRRFWFRNERDRDWFIIRWQS